MTDKKIKSQTILRASHNKQNPYVMISKKVLSDRRLSPKGMGLMCYLLGLPDHWRICVEELCSHFSAGEKSIKSGLRELILLGYIERFQPKLSSGMYGPVEMIVHEEPSKNSKQVKKSPELHNPPLACFGPAVIGAPDKGLKNSKQVKKSPELHNPPLACFGLAQKGTLVNNDQVNIYINDNNKHDLVQDPEGSVVVDLETVGKLAKIGVNKKTAVSWIGQYGKEDVENKLQLLQVEISRGTIRHSRAGWLKTALAQNWTESEIKKIQRENQIEKRKAEEEDRKIQIEKRKAEDEYRNSPEREKKIIEIKKLGGLKGLLKVHQQKLIHESNYTEKKYPEIWNSKEVEDKLDRVFEGVKNRPEKKTETVKTLKELLDSCLTSVKQIKSC